MSDDRSEVVVAGHICLDIIPTFDPGQQALGSLLTPGKLINVGPAVTATGGAVSNAGLAMHRLGVPTRLMGKVGDDVLGRAILDLLGSAGGGLAEGMIAAPGEQSSYSIVISPPGTDRIFLHCPGANNTFGAADIPYDRLRPARLLHFGYPPLMQRMYSRGGAELADMLARIKQVGLTTSLDMAMIDPASPAAAVDWPALLKLALPHVDVFLPSLDEMLFMLDRAKFSRMSAGASGGLMSQVDGRLLWELSGRLIEMGVAIVGLKLGDQGLYVRTGSAKRIEACGLAAPADVANWSNRELLAPCFSVEVAGTTGSGDCTIAGFLAGLIKGLSCEQTATGAVAVGACNVERPDATSGVIHWDKVQQRIAANWPRRSVGINLPHWRSDSSGGLVFGPHDKEP